MSRRSWQIWKPRLKTDKDVIDMVTRRANMAVAISNEADEVKRNKLWRIFKRGTLLLVKVVPWVRQARTYNEWMKILPVQKMLNRAKLLIGIPVDPKGSSSDE